jgi:hypothetical protein
VDIKSSKFIQISVRVIDAAKIIRIGYISDIILYSNRIDLRITATRGLIPLSINKSEQLKLESPVICKPFLFEYTMPKQTCKKGN